MNRPQSLTRYHKFHDFLNKNFNIIGDYKTYEELQAANLDLDAYIVGSDQVWNPSHIGGFDPAYFLNFAKEGRKKISYAASVGSDYIHPKYKDDIKDSLASYTAISVRERSIQDEVQELTTKPVEVVLDPTMLLEKEDYEEIKVESSIKEPYILVYMMEKNQQVVSLANTISISLGLPTIQRRYTKGLINQLPPFYTADAGEFIGLIEGAECVITNSFHGTVFSILYNKPFVSMLHSDTGSRTVDLLTELGLESHILYDISDFKEFSMFHIEDPAEIRIRLENLRRSSSEFLLKSLELSDRYNMLHCPTGITIHHCYGCNACADICKVGAIRMVEDKEGFLYPEVDEAKCTDCGMCNKICIRNKSQAIEYAESYPKAYCAYNTDLDTRKTSSSGAIFPMLARYMIEEKQGVVVGVRYDENMRAVSAIAETMEDAKAFRGSKYVKSDFRGIFPKVKELLKNGRHVLYSGLPCECAGLRAFLRKDYDNLIICEIVCHSAPSPKVFEKYVEHLGEKNNSKVVDLCFRGKEQGWRRSKCEVVVTYENGEVKKERTAENIYYRAFIAGSISRHSCNYCQYTYDSRVGDFTIGDAWGIHEVAPELYDNKGVNLLLVNNEKAEKIFETIKENLRLKESTIEEVFIKNHKRPTRETRKRIVFFDEMEKKEIASLLEEHGKK